MSDLQERASGGSDEDVLVEGPWWAPHTLDVRPGRFPLSVESHLMNMTARLVPGATTVTINARYYALHGAVAHEAERRQLETADAAELLRRCEVVVAGASVLRPSDISGLPHGYDRVKPRMEEAGLLDVASLSTPRSGYANPTWGFLGPYLGSELTLQILAASDLRPGDRADRSVLREAFDGLFDLAAQDQVSLEDLRNSAHLTNGAGLEQPDGPWLARQLCNVGINNPVKSDVTRRGTARLIARSIALSPQTTPETAFQRSLAYGSAGRLDPVVTSIPEAAAWQGVIFRRMSIGAWRQMWAWLVGEIAGLTAPSDLQDAMAAALGGGSLGEFLDQLPAISDPDGDPAPAEEEVESQERTIASRSLALVALGAARTHQLTGRAREALVGDETRPTVLSPIWVDHWLNSRRDRAMADVAAELVTELLDRSRRIALKKKRIGQDGRMWLPTRVHERGEFLYKTSNEGRANVGLRIRQLADLLHQTGVIEHVDGSWQVTDFGAPLVQVGDA